MSNPPKGARLWLRPATAKRAAVWIIRDGKEFKSTGCGHDDRESAEQGLAAYIAEKYEPDTTSSRHPSKISIADVMSIYATFAAGKVARPKELGQRIKALLAFFGGKALSAVNGDLCRAYVEQRTSVSLARRELEDLRTAINHHRREGLCSEIVGVALPEKSQRRERWLTRSEAAKLIWEAWRGGQGKRKHVARFILVGLYTGTRAGAICGAAVRPTIGRGYVDLDKGVFYRRAPEAKETKKRQTPVRLHDRLLAHLRRWERMGITRRCVVEFEDEPIGRMNKAFRHTARDAGLADVHPHVLRHTSVTWAMQNGADLWDAAGQFGMTTEMLQEVYGHHRPDFGKDVMRALGSKPGKR